MNNNKRYYGLFSIIMCMVLMCSMTSCIRKKQDLGKKVSQTQKVDDFQRIKVTGNAVVVCHKGAATAVKVSGYEAEMKQVTVKVEDGCLIVNQSSASAIRQGAIFSTNTNTVVIDVTVPQLDGCEVSGNADVRIQDTMTVPRFALDVSGNASCYMQALASDSLSMQVSGNADATLDLAAIAKYVYVGSGGNASAQLFLEHAGDVEAEAVGNADITLTGTYTGKLNSQASGNSSVENHANKVTPKK